MFVGRIGIELPLVKIIAYYMASSYFIKEI